MFASKILAEGADADIDTGPDFVTTCPNCGGDHHESNHIDEGLYRAAAREVPFLVFEGRRNAAKELLAALYVVRIFNRTRPAFLCLSCGVTFDG